MRGKVEIFFMPTSGTDRSRRIEVFAGRRLAEVGFSGGIFRRVVGPSLVDMLVLFKQAGIRFIDWCHDQEHNRIYTPEEYG